MIAPILVLASEAASRMQTTPSAPAPRHHASIGLERAESIIPIAAADAQP